MASLDRNLRRDLKNAVKKARRVAEAGARAALVSLRIGEGRVPAGPEAALRRRLRAHGRQLGDTLDERKETQSIERLKDECAYQHWHRLLFARFLAENDLLVEPDSGMALSLDECRELARERGKDWLILASDFAQRMLPQIFRAGDPVLEVALPPEKRQELEAILERLPREVFVADDSLGWVYQFWQSDHKNSVNASENKIGPEELPAVTQLFTEDYMVLFLLHNTLGAWWAGKVLGATRDLARAALTEDELRSACSVPGIEWTYLRFVREDDWRPAAGTFSGWPTAAKDVTVLDPCMGSGHFLAFALPMLVSLRREEEKLSDAEAVDAVLRDNLFGLELDQRCTQIAAFNVGLTAWKLAGYRPLPALNLACAGLGINAPITAWTALAAGDAFEENAMKQLYELFRQAPTLGSLIDPSRVGGELFVAHFDKIRSLFSHVLASEQSEDSELAVVAQGIARAAMLLAERYTLVATNVPYLASSGHSEVLLDFLASHHPEARHDLATALLERVTRFTASGGVLAVVTPQNWLSTGRYEALRMKLLREESFGLIVQLGAGAFSSISGEVVKPALLIGQHALPASDGEFLALDASSARGSKDLSLKTHALTRRNQLGQLANVDSRITTVDSGGGALLSQYVEAAKGICTFDGPRFLMRFWERSSIDGGFIPSQSTVEAKELWGGAEYILRWDGGEGSIAELMRGKREEGYNSGAWQVWARFMRRRGVLVSPIGELHCTEYLGFGFDNNTVVLIPRDQNHLRALRAYCWSDEYRNAVRVIDQQLKVTDATLAKVPFDLERWTEVAEEKWPTGLPSAQIVNPTQWLFSGAPSEATAVLQVALARLLGFQWPRQQGLSISDCSAIPRDGLEKHSDEDGIVCIAATRGEGAAAERVRALLADAFGTAWSAQTLNELLAGADFRGKSLDDWLRDGFFEQHCALFHHRPFLWQIWDGRKDGFSALVNYHKLAAANGEGRRILDKVTHTYLGDWLDRQRADQKKGVEGADGRVAAAEHLKRELEKILEGEPPYDIFIRWKPLHQQPVGWEPDIDDGVRVNIRPFMTAKPLNARARNACILRVAPRIKWDKDRGKEPTREKADYPWFWGWDEETQNFMGGSGFDGNRWNDLHYSRAVKLAARECAKAGKP